MIEQNMLLKAGVKLEDLSSLKKVSPFYALKVVFLGHRPKDDLAYALVMNFIRMVDQILYSYQDAFHNLCKCRNMKMAHIIYAISSLENCITSLQRAQKLLKALRRNDGIPQELKELIPRDIKVIQNKIIKNVNDVRNAIMHIEDKLVNGEISSENANLCLIPNEANIEIGKYKIEFIDLALWIKELHKYALILNDYHD
jgi:hypothetical protein